ncbi:MAG: POTRA domain-containing protein, partial [Candidatus Latescibacteria bacterium]|nr:POTRA domain-containing protein [Candidatus Latescibacterota bacterium]
MRFCLLCLFLPAYPFLAPVSLRAQHNQGLEVDRVVIRGNQAMSTDDIITALGFESGNVFDRHTLDQNINRMLLAYADQGYLWTEITSLDIQLSPDSSAVSFTLHIREGPVARVDH